MPSPRATSTAPRKSPGAALGAEVSAAATGNGNDHGGAAGPAAGAGELPPLTATQAELVEICADAVQQLGLPRSLGQIYGVIYCSPQPLAFADVVTLLGLSNGSVSQGMRVLRELGAIRPVAGETDPRELFVAETELRKLLAGVLESRLRAPLEAGQGRLRALEQRLAGAARANGAHAAEPDPEFLRQRLSSLQTWHRKALRFLPMIQSLLGPASRGKR